MQDVVVEESLIYQLGQMHPKEIKLTHVTADKNFQILNMQKRKEKKKVKGSAMANQPTKYSFTSAYSLSENKLCE